MKSAPTDRHRDMARRHSGGQSLAEIAAAFETSVEGVCRAVKRVEDYDRGTALLQHDSANIEGLSLVGMLPPLTRLTLHENGITRLTELEAISADDLLRLPNMRKRTVERLLALLDQYRSDASPKLPDRSRRAHSSSAGSL
jgi:hypothetical protein